MKLYTYVVYEITSKYGDNRKGKLIDTEAVKFCLKILLSLCKLTGDLENFNAIGELET